MTCGPGAPSHFATRSPCAPSSDSAASRSWIAPTSVVVALVCLLTILPQVFAASPQRLATPVTDDAGALTGKVAEVQAALNDLQDATGTQLWVWFTDTLGGQDPPAFATETARLSDLGPNDLLLVIALDDRAYGYWKGDSVEISDAALGDILSRDLEAGLRSGRRRRGDRDDRPGADHPR